MPGNPEKSLLFQNLAAKADPHMPPKKQLTDAERESVRAWIAAMSTAPVDPAPKPKPARHFDGITQAVDTLIAEGWEARGVNPAAAVDERTWCRRLYLDLAGRIPTPAEAGEFLASRRRKENARRSWTRLLASDEYAVHMR